MNNIIPMANALPKSGTNLLQKLFELMGYGYDGIGIAESLVLGKHYYARQLLRGALLEKNPVTIGFYSPVSVSGKWLNKRLGKVKENNYISGHCNYSDRVSQIFMTNNVKVVNIVRDPRDVLVSHAHYFAEKKGYFLYPMLSKLSFEERVIATLAGGEFKDYGLSLNSYATALNQVLDWSVNKETLLVKFEDLVGEKGGGTKEEQYEAIKKIVDFLGRDDLADEESILNLGNSLYGGTHTFRKGQKGGWKIELSNSLVDEVEARVGDQIQKLGYIL